MTAACQLEQFGKKAKLGVEVVVKRRMVVHVIAAEICERCRCQSYAIEPMLV